MLSTTAEYALRIMIALAEADGQPITSETLSQRTSVSADYAVKILQQMARASLVHAQRGRGGGFRLACDPTRTTLLDVVNVIDPIERIHTCPLGRPTHQSRLCALHSRLDNAIAVLQSELQALTLEDVAADEGRGPLCPREPTVDMTLSTSAPSDSQE